MTLEKTQSLSAFVTKQEFLLRCFCSFDQVIYKKYSLRWSSLLWNCSISNHSVRFDDRNDNQLEDAIASIQFQLNTLFSLTITDLLPVMNRCISVVQSFKSTCQSLAPVYRSVYILASRFFDFSKINEQEPITFRFLFYWSFTDPGCREYKLYINSVTKRKQIVFIGEQD